MSEKDLEPETRQLRDLSARTFWLAAALGGIAVLLLAGLLALIVLVTSDADSAGLWTNVVTRSLTVIAGFGGAFALWLTFRRQRAHEIATRIDQDQRAEEARVNRKQREREQQHREDDARDARITELRIQAVEQLGSDRAAVRIGGLHNLERLGQQHPDLRQLILNEICAYLRMPYTPPENNLTSSELFPRGLADDAVDYSASSRPDASTDTRQEREVRLTAQGILERHLIPDNAEYWKHKSLNLVGAVLEDLRLIDARLSNINLRSAILIGESNFASTIFERAANFDSVTFKGSVVFYSATFKDRADFSSATFESNVAFGSVKFEGQADFEATTFKDMAIFGSATFTSWADFEAATFVSRAAFTSARFIGWVDFSSATFQGDGDFTAVTFERDADFEAATFEQDVYFVRAVFRESIDLRCVAAISSEKISHFWPTAWRLEPAADRPGYGRLVRRAPRESGSRLFSSE